VAARTFDLVQSHERIPGCDLYRAGDGVHRRWLQQRSRILPGWKSRLLFADRYHRYVMQAEREMYQDSHLRGVICNAEMIKREIIEDFGLPAGKSTLSITPLITSVFCRRRSSLCRATRQMESAAAGDLPDLRRLRL
jgi:hypothetical protein